MNELTPEQKNALVELIAFAQDHAYDVYMTDAVDDDEQTAGMQENCDSILAAAKVLDHFIEDEGVYDNDICPSAPRPLMEGETAHKWDDTATPVACSECGAENDSDIHHD